MVCLSSRRLLVSHYLGSTVSFRIPLCGMRGLPPILDSGIVLSIRIDNLGVFINKTSKLPPN
jgi:hypothetical protein